MHKINDCKPVVYKYCSAKWTVCDLNDYNHNYKLIEKHSTKKKNCSLKFKI